MTDTLTRSPETPDRSIVTRLLREVSRAEWIVYGVIAAVMLALVLIEPDILEAPFENANTILFTVAGTAIALVALVVMLWFRVPPLVRMVVLVVPFVVVNWWLLEPYFVDDVVDEDFETSIAAALADEDAATPVPDASATPEEPSSQAPGAQEPAEADPATPAAEPEPEPEIAPETAEPVPPAEPVLRGAGSFVGLAGHSGSGDAGIFENPDGSQVLRFENFDIQNGPDLKVYLVPGADMTSVGEGSINLGALKGNVGDQTYDLPPGTTLAAGPYTALVWCEAFSVEFVGATLSVA